MKVQELLIKESSRADSYKLLSECYYLPDEKLLQKIHSLDESIGWPCCELVKHVPDTNNLESLKIDFSRLFVGPFKLLAPPYGSVYLENSRTVMGDSTINVRDTYRQEGLDVSIKEAHDHIAIELEFMHFLIAKELQAAATDSPTYLEKQKYFLNTHLGKWISDFAVNIKENAQTEFYRNLSRITETFVIEDLKYLSDR